MISWPVLFQSQRTEDHVQQMHLQTTWAWNVEASMVLISGFQLYWSRTQEHL